MILMIRSFLLDPSGWRLLKREMQTLLLAPPPTGPFPASNNPCPVLAYLGADFSVSDTSRKHKTTVRWLVICGKGRFDLFAVVVVPLGSYGPCGILTRICRFKVVDLNLNFNFSRSESDQDEAIIPSFEARNRTGLEGNCS